MNFFVFLKAPGNVSFFHVKCSMLYNCIVPVVSKIPKRVDYKFNNFLEQIIFMCKNYEMFFYFEDFFLNS